MRNTIVATGVAVCLITGTLGCKTASKMAWWKSSDSSVESTAMTHSAPSLPADIAKQAEAFASTSPSIEMSTSAAQAPSGSAPPYKPAPSLTPPAPSFSPTASSVAAAPAYTPGSATATTPTAYPSTGASSYSAAAAPSVAASSRVMPNMRTADSSAHLGSVDMPYNPNAVPPAKTIAAAAPKTPAATADRYGASVASNPTPSYGSATVPSAQPASVPQASGSSRYGNVATATPTMPPATADLVTNAAASRYGSPATVAAPASATTTTNSMGSRYASATPTTNAPPTISTTVPPTASNAASVAQAPTPKPAVTLATATSSTYRPGGTTSYAGLAAGQSSVEVAARPNATPTQVPNVSAPGSPPETPSTQGQRY